MDAQAATRSARTLCDGRILLWLAVLVASGASLLFTAVAGATNTTTLGPPATTTLALADPANVAGDARRITARRNLLRQLRQAAQRVDAASEEIAALLAAADVDPTKIRAAGNRLATAARKADKVLRSYRKAKKRFGSVEELVLAKVMSERLDDAREKWEKVASTPGLAAALPALASGDIEELKAVAEAEAERYVRSKLPEEAKVLQELLKKGSFKDLLRELSDDAKAHIEARAAEAINDAFADAVPADALGGVDAAAFEELIATGRFDRFIKRALKERVRQRLEQRLAGLLIKVKSGGIVVQIASELIIKWLGPKLQEAVRFKGKVDRRTQITLKGFANRTRELTALKRRGDVERARRLVTRAEQALGATRFLKQDLRARGRLDLLAKLEAAEAALRSLIAKCRRTFGMAAKGQVELGEINEDVGGLAGLLDQLVAERCPLTIACTPAGGSGLWHGRWSTPFGDMVLTQAGSGVTGCYERENSTITGGKASGDVLTGTWTNRENLHPSNPDLDTGMFSWTLAADGGSFSGSWTYRGSSSGGSWTGTKVSDSATPACSG